MSTTEVGRPTDRRLRPPSVVSLIKDYILTNRLGPGDVMPTESELSEELGVSRSRIRESIKTLSALDIVEVRHGYGTYVGRMSLSALVESLAFRGALLSPGDSSVIGDLVDIREMLEIGLATPMIEAVTKDQLSELRRLTDVMTSLAAEGNEFLTEDRAFHLILMEPTGNQLAVQLTGAFWDVHSIVTSAIAPVSDLVATADAHVEIVDAIEDRDTERLRRAISHHYEPIRQRITSAPERG